MTEKQFAEIGRIRVQIRKNRDTLDLLKGRCFISLKSNNRQTSIHDEEVTKVLINFFEERISKLEKQFAEL